MDPQACPHGQSCAPEMVEGRLHRKSNLVPHGGGHAARRHHLADAGERDLGWTGKAAGSNPGEKAHEDSKVNGQYVNTPEKGVVGIPFIDNYATKDALDFLDDAAKTPGKPFFINVNFMKVHQLL